jgi:DNA-binding CsgD family transcriptional regulator
MSTLSERDFENIFKFYTELNNQYDDFENAALRLLAELFGLRMTTYAIFDMGDDAKTYVRQVISYTFRADRLEQYRRHYYKKDLFYNNIHHVMYASKYVYTSDAFPLGVFRNSEYGRWLAEINIGHQAVLGGVVSAHYPIHVLCAYKAIEDDPFNERELELLHYIGKAFSETMGLYKERLRHRRLQELTGFFADTLELGYAILDSKLQPLSYNSQFITFGTQLSSCMEVSAIIADLVDLVTAQQGAVPGGGGVVEAWLSGHIVALREKKFPISSHFESYTFLTIRPAPARNAAAPAAQAPAEHLTPREQEVMELLHKGMNNSEIAAALYVSQSTAKSHIRNLSIKLGATSRANLRRIIEKRMGRR